jgi:hypothetical protein
MIRKVCLTFALILAVGGGTLAYQANHSAPAHANATTCVNHNSYTNCDNQDPTSGNPNCTYPAYNQETVTIANGWGKNWWSSGCNSNWGQVSANSGFVVEFVFLYRAFYSSSYCNTNINNSNTCANGATILTDYPYTSSWYTNILYSPVGTSVRVCFGFAYSSDHYEASTGCSAWH